MQVGKLRKERTAVKGQLDPLRVMMHPVNKMTVSWSAILMLACSKSLILASY